MAYANRTLSAAIFCCHTFINYLLISLRMTLNLIATSMEAPWPCGLRHWIWYLEDPGSNPLSYSSLDFVLGSSESNFSTALWKKFVLFTLFVYVFTVSLICDPNSYLFIYLFFYFSCSFARIICCLVVWFYSACIHVWLSVSVCFYDCLSFLQSVYLLNFLFTFCNIHLNIFIFIYFVYFLFIHIYFHTFVR